VAIWYAERHSSGFERFERDFDGAIALLSEFPFAGRKREERSGGLRSYNVHPHVMFYRVDEVARTISLLRIAHAHRDLGPDFEFD
jgi:plasmid stabilization system protein ParE